MFGLSRSTKNLNNGKLGLLGSSREKLEYVEVRSIRFNIDLKVWKLGKLDLRKKFNF